MSSRETEHLRVLIADERKDRLALVASTVVVPLGRLAACPEPGSAMLGRLAVQ